MIRILVTGGAGQVATALAAIGPARGFPIMRVGRPEFDFDRPDTIDATFARTAPRPRGQRRSLHCR